MPQKANPRRYAQALFEIAQEHTALEQWRSDLQRLAGAAANADFLAVMESPRIKFEEKSGLLEQLGGVSPVALNLARLLVVKHAINIIGEIAGEYERLVNAYLGIRKAKVITAVPIDDEDKKKLAQDLGTVTGLEIILEPEVDPAILGGIIARIDGKLLDGSTRTRLETLKRNLAGEGSKRKNSD
jgi:F-type H+-transporting ATPase subunit delta